MRHVLWAVLILSGWAWARPPGSYSSDVGHSSLAVVAPADGHLLAHYLLDTVLWKQIAASQEVPHLAFTKRFLSNGPIGKYRPPRMPDHAGKLHGHPFDLGETSQGDRLVLLNEKDSYDFAAGPLCILRSDRRLHVLLPRIHYNCAGRSCAIEDPDVEVAGPYLLVDGESGMAARRLADGAVLWRSPGLHFSWCRFGWGAWYAGGALYVNTADGLTCVNPASGAPQWTLRDVGEVSKVALGPDGRLYVKYNSGDRAVQTQLHAAAVARYHLDEEAYVPLMVVPYKTSYFGRTYRGPASHANALSEEHGTEAVWEYSHGRWLLIFDFDPYKMSLKQINALYARYGLSSAMRRRLETFDEYGPGDDDPE